MQGLRINKHLHCHIVFALLLLLDDMRFLKRTANTNPRSVFGLLKKRQNQLIAAVPPTFLAVRGKFDILRSKDTVKLHE
jgi:hypothetical protein